MLKIGLTGGIGSGKSLIASIFTHMGVPVYNSDDRAKYLMINNTELINSIKILFGDKAFINKTLNRELIASTVFSNPDILDQLNSIVHPAVANDFQEWCSTQQKRNIPFIVKEAAILFESGAYKLMDKSILVVAPEEIRIERVIQRDGATIEDVHKRLQNQLSAEKVIPLADYIIDNGGKELILPQLLKVYNKILN